MHRAMPASKHVCTHAYITYIHKHNVYTHAYIQSHTCARSWFQLHASGFLTLMHACTHAHIRTWIHACMHILRTCARRWFQSQTNGFWTLIQARSTSRAGQWCSATRLDALVRMSLSRCCRVAIAWLSCGHPVCRTVLIACHACTHCKHMTRMRMQERASS